MFPVVFRINHLLVVKVVGGGTQATSRKVPPTPLAYEVSQQKKHYKNKDRLSTHQQTNTLLTPDHPPPLPRNDSAYNQQPGGA